MKYKARKAIDNIEPYVPGKPLDEVARQLGIKDEIVKLASNENPLGPSPLAVAKIKEILNELNYYPDDNAYYLKEKLSSIYNVSQDWITIANGSAELIVLSVISHLDKKHGIVMGWPCFIIPKIAACFVEAPVTCVPVKEDYYHDVDCLLSSVTNSTRILYLDNPTNPLGTILDAEQIVYILKKTPDHVLVILDQAYEEYLPDGLSVSVREILSARKNLLLLRTFSKIYGLAGLRAGYGLSNPEIARNISKVRVPFNANSLAQKAAIHALDDREHVEKSKSLNASEKQFLSDELNKRNFRVLDSFANFVTFETIESAGDLFMHLQNRGIITRPLNSYRIENLLRVTTGTRKQDQKFLDALDNYHR